MMKNWLVITGWVCAVSVSAGISAEPSEAFDAVGGELQSAYLQRNDRGSKTHFHPLEHHFENVLKILEDSEEWSLDIAIERSSELWGEIETNGDRLLRKARLAENRRLNIEALRAYRNRGDFPVNDYQIGRVPVFVDRRGTACAVGHLMRMSGTEADVRTIVERNRFIYVPDAKDGPLVRWILGSGLIQEEAALIQPSYGFWPPPETTQDAMISGEELVGENLRTSGLEYIVIPSLTDESTRLAASAITSVKGGSGQFGQWRPTTWARYRSPSHFLTFGSAAATDGGPWLSSRGSPEVTHVFEYEFDLEIVDEMVLYDFGIGISEYENVKLAPDARVRITSSVYAADGYVLA